MFKIKNLSNNPLSLTVGRIVPSGTVQRESVGDKERKYERRGWLRIFDETPAKEPASEPAPTPEPTPEPVINENSAEEEPPAEADKPEAADTTQNPAQPAKTKGGKSK
jgi:hypothetical protein